MAQPYQPSARRIPELNGVRVLLVFIVSWYHIWQQSWLGPYVGGYSLDYLVRTGYMPVDGLILLSGFLLFLPYARTMLLGEPMPSVRTFYQRRIMRIVPSYYFVLLLTLFVVALPYGLYSSSAQMAEDLAAHLTFTHTFFRTTYLGTQIGGVTWTLAIEMQAYLIFPLIARLAMKNTAGTTGFMFAVAWMFRGLCLWQMDTYGMVVNQLPNFLDVYATGILAALAYVKLTELWKRARWRLLWEALATAAVVLCVWGLIQVMRAQARSATNDLLQAGQMMRRTELAALLAVAMVALPFTLLPLRALMGNRVMGWLGAISFNFYLVHQTVAVHLKHRLHIPPATSELSADAAEAYGQLAQLWGKFGLPILIGAAVAAGVLLGVEWLGKRAASAGHHVPTQRGQALRRFRVPLLAAAGLAVFFIAMTAALMGRCGVGPRQALSMMGQLVRQSYTAYIGRYGAPLAEGSFIPNQMGDRLWQYPYTWLSFGISLVLATAITLLIEKPAAWALGKLFGKLSPKPKAS